MCREKIQQRQPAPRCNYRAASQPEDCSLSARLPVQTAGFLKLADTWADTTTPNGGLMVTVLAGLAEFERALILVRTACHHRPTRWRPVHGPCGWREYSRDGSVI
jgi:hypothetical protein